MPVFWRQRLEDYLYYKPPRSQAGPHNIRLWLHKPKIKPTRTNQINTYCVCGQTLDLSVISKQRIIIQIYLFLICHVGTMRVCFQSIPSFNVLLIIWKFHIIYFIFWSYPFPITTLSRSTPPPYTSNFMFFFSFSLYKQNKIWNLVCVNLQLLVEGSAIQCDW